MIDIIINNKEIIAGAIFTASITGYIILRNRRKKRTARAADVFRTKVLAEIEGIYPIPRYIDTDVFEKFRESVPKIESAAAEFRHFVPSGSQNSFDNALKNYCDHCNRITWEECVTYNAVPVKRKPEEIGPKEIFRQNVNTLLSF